MGGCEAISCHPYASAPPFLHNGPAACFLPQGPISRRLPFPVVVQSGLNALAWAGMKNVRGEGGLAGSYPATTTRRLLAPCRRGAEVRWPPRQLKFPVSSVYALEVIYAQVEDGRPRLQNVPTVRAPQECDLSQSHTRHLQSVNVVRVYCLKLKLQVRTPRDFGFRAPANGCSTRPRTSSAEQLRTALRAA